MAIGNPNDYWYKITQALKKNHKGITFCYKDFDSFWKDFEYGLKHDFHIGPGLLYDFYKKQLYEVWKNPKYVYKTINRKD